MTDDESLDPRALRPLHARDRRCGGGVPQCKDSIANTAESGTSVGLPAGFNYSIYVMLAGLFACWASLASRS